MEQPENVKKPELKTGMTVEVLSMDNQIAFSGKVTECSQDGVTIQDARGRDLPVGVYGKEVKLRFERGDNNLMVHGKIRRSSPDEWRIEELEEQFTAPRRAFFRQRIEVDGEVICNRRSSEQPQLRRGSAWTACKLTNVSAGGLQLSSGEPFQVGDALAVRKVRLVERGTEFSFSCHVRRAVTGEDGKTVCGCQIDPLPSKEQTQLEEAIFRLQREEIQRKRERGL